MRSLKLRNSFELLNVESEIEKIVAGFVLHGNFAKTVRQLFALRARNSGSLQAVSLIDKAILRFRKAKRFDLL